MAADTPSQNGQAKPKKRRHFLSNPTASYHPNSLGWWGYGSAALDGAPIFTWLDVPRMIRDPQVRFIERLWRAPFQKVKWKVKAHTEGCANFVANTLRRFWRGSLPRILSKYWRYGYAGAGAEFTATRDWLRLARVRATEPRDSRPRVWTHGPAKGQFAGFHLHSDGEERFVGAPHAMWFAGLQELSEYYDSAPLSGLFEPWLEKCGRQGAKHLRRLWFRKHAADGGEIRYPPGQSNVGTDENPAVRDNQDIARELGDYHETMGVIILENTANPAMEGEYEWKYNPAVGRPDVAGFREYPRDMDLEMLDGACIPREVVQSSESGSGYNGRLMPYQGFLGTVDELSGLMVESCESWLTPLNTANFGESAWYEIELISLSDVAEQEEMQRQKRSGELPAKPGGGGDLPFTLSTLDERLADEGWKRTEAGDYIQGERQRKKKSFVMSATVTPEDNPDAKAAAFSATTGKLMRSRKATIAQLLALAMIRTQQRATAAGKPEAAAGSLTALSEMAGDPVQVAKIVGMKELSAVEMSALELAWTRIDDGPRGGIRVQNSETGSIRRGPAALELLRKQGMRERGLPTTERQMSRSHARLTAHDVVTRAGTGKVEPEDLKALSHSLSKLTGKELKGLATYLKVNLHSERRASFMVDRLLDHVDKLVGVESAPRSAERDAQRGAAKAEKKQAVIPEQKVEGKPAEVAGGAEPVEEQPKLAPKSEGKVEEKSKKEGPKVLDAATAAKQFPKHVAMRGEYGSLEPAMEEARTIPGAHVVQTDEGYQIIRPPVAKKSAGSASTPGERDALAREMAEDRTISSEPAPPVKPGEKKPWEMTPQEFMAAAQKGKLRQASGKNVKGEETARNPIEFGEANGYHPDDVAHFYFTKFGRDGFSAAHRAYLEDAIESGKPIPPEALADYPDLAPKVKDAAKGEEAKAETPEPVKEAIAKKVEKPIPEKRAKNAPVHVPEQEAQGLKAAVAYNAVVEAAKGGASPEALGKLVERAKSAASGVPEGKRTAYLSHLENAARGKGSLLPLPKADESQYEDVQPDEEVPEAETPPAPPEPEGEGEETPEVEKSALEVKAEKARDAWKAAVSAKKPAAEVARLKKRLDEYAQALPEEKRAELLGKPSAATRAAVKSIIAEDPELARRRAKLEALKAAPKPEGGLPAIGAEQPKEEAPAAAPTEAASSKGMPHQVPRAVATWEDSSKPLSERLNKLADLDTNLIDAPYTSGALEGVPRNNEYFRHLNNVFQRWQEGDKRSPMARKNIEGAVSSLEQDARYAAQKLREAARSGAVIKDGMGKPIDYDLNAAADLYERLAPEAAQQVREAVARDTSGSPGPAADKSSTGFMGGKYLGADDAARQLGMTRADFDWALKNVESYRKLGMLRNGSDVLFKTSDLEALKNKIAPKPGTPAPAASEPQPGAGAPAEVAKEGENPEKEKETLGEYPGSVTTADLISPSMANLLRDVTSGAQQPDAAAKDLAGYLRSKGLAPLENLAAKIGASPDEMATMRAKSDKYDATQYKFKSALAQYAADKLISHALKRGSPAPEAGKSKDKPKREPKKPPKEAKKTAPKPATPRSEARASEEKRRAQQDYSGLTPDEKAGTKEFDTVRNKFVDHALALSESTDDPKFKDALEMIVHNLPTTEIVGASGWKAVADGRSVKELAKQRFLERLATNVGAALAELSDDRPATTKLLDAARKFGFVEHGPAVGKGLQFDPRYYGDGGYQTAGAGRQGQETDLTGVFSGDPVVVVRPPVLVKTPDGKTIIARKGVVKKRTV